MDKKTAISQYLLKKACVKIPTDFIKTKIFEGDLMDRSSIPTSFFKIFSSYIKLFCVAHLKGISLGRGAQNSPVAL